MGDDEKGLKYDLREKDDFLIISFSGKMDKRHLTVVHYCVLVTEQ